MTAISARYWSKIYCRSAFQNRHECVKIDYIFRYTSVGSLLALVDDHINPVSQNVYKKENIMNILIYI